MFVSIVFAAMLAVAPAPSAPSAEARALGLRLARTGTLAALLPLMTGKETEEMVAADPKLTAAEQATLRQTAKDVAERHTGQLMAAMGDAYAAKLSLPELRALVASNETPAATHYRAAQPAVIAQTMQAAGTIDFKAETMAAFCKETGKGCAKP